MHLPTWSVARLRIFAALTIASAAAISFESIRHLAETAGFGVLAWLFPLTLDAVAAYGMDLWVRRSPAMKSARWLALAAILGSLVANVVDHYMVQRSYLGAVLGAVPPAALAALLAVAHRHGAGTAVPQLDLSERDRVWRSLGQADRAVPDMPQRYRVPDRVWTVERGPLAGPPVGPMLRAAVPERIEVPRRYQVDSPALVPDHPVPLKPVRSRTSAARVAGTTRRTAALHSDDEIVSWIKAQPVHPSKGAVMNQFGVGTPKALRLKKIAREA